MQTRRLWVCFPLGGTKYFHSYAPVKRLNLYVKVISTIWADIGELNVLSVRLLFGTKRKAALMLRKGNGLQCL